MKAKKLNGNGKKVTARALNKNELYQILFDFSCPRAYSLIKKTRPSFKLEMRDLLPRGSPLYINAPYDDVSKKVVRIWRNQPGDRNAFVVYKAKQDGYGDPHYVHFFHIRSGARIS